MRAWVGVVLSVVWLASCTAGGRDELVVFAAASLRPALLEVADRFEARTGARVRFNFGASDRLAVAIGESGGADVFASASTRWMAAVAAGPGVGSRSVFARARLALIVPPDNPAGIGALSDVARPGIRLVLAGESVPAGEYARALLERAGLTGALRNVVSNEQDASGVAAKVASGDADAGIVYEPDRSPAVRRVSIDPSLNEPVAYEIATVGAQADPRARAFVSAVVDAREVFAARGYLAP